MRRAFTLIELLTIVAIAGIMAVVATVGIVRGQSGARIKGSTRDIFSTIRRARSVALVTQKPCIITYSTQVVDGEVSAKVVITSARLMNSSGVTEAQTLSGETVRIGEDADAPAPEAGADGEAPVETGGGETIEDILFQPISDDVVRGVAIKVKVGDEMLEDDPEEERQKTKISVFSNVDYLLGRYKDAKAEEAKKTAAAEEKSESAESPATTDLQEPVSVVWEVNGRCEPHRVWIYPAGGSPDQGLSIKVDRFGAAKVLAQGEDD